MPDKRAMVDHLDHNLAGKLIAYLLIEREVRRIPDLIERDSIHSVMIETLMASACVRVD